MNEEQRKGTILGVDKSRDFLVAGAGRDNVSIDHAGVRASLLDPAQKLALLEFINLFVGNLRDEHARIKLDQVQLHRNDTYFAWIGGNDANAVLYYRIQSPVILIEFDHQGPIGMRVDCRRVPTRQHIHTTCARRTATTTARTCCVSTSNNIRTARLRFEPCGAWISSFEVLSPIAFKRHRLAVLLTVKKLHVP